MLTVMRSRRRDVTPHVVVLLSVGAALASRAAAQTTTARRPAAKAAPAAHYQAEIRWTSYGIPHVKATEWGGLGYGFAYATATDAVCTIARDVIMVNGELTKHFGAGDGNRESDVFHRAVLADTTVRAFDKTQSANSNRFSAGYVAGYNRFLRDHAKDLPAACRNTAWVRPITLTDVSRLTIGVGIRYGLGRFQKEIANAAPPGKKVEGLSTDFTQDAGEGSNAVAMGKAVTASGRGLLLGNPHYPWQGSSRFHLIHTTIPGVLDVMGVSLYTTSRVSIGFNKDVAWSHTVSTGLRSTLYALDLNPEDPTQYRYGTEWRRMTRTTVQVPGTSETRDVYLTHYGPVLVSDPLPWTTSKAYAVRDVNLANTRSADTYDALNVARSVDEVEAAISKQGVFWTNTIAADRNGTAFYADISVVPNVDSAQLARCRVRPAGVPPTIVVMNGADPTCEWVNDAKSSVPGAMPASMMPRLRRDDFVTNSNDSYWLANPASPLIGYSPIIGAEATPRSLRTRAGLMLINEALKDGHKVTPSTLQEMLFSQRNYGAELMLDEVLGLCRAPIEPVALPSGSVDITPSCKALAGWTRRETTESRGAHVWREFWRFAARIPGLYKVPFNAADAANTPRGLAVEQPAVREGLRRALAQAQQRLSQFGIAADATLGSIQFEDRNGEHIPIPGGDGATGMWSVITTELKKDGYTPIITGNSYIQVIGWNADGTIDARGILTYSQSEDPASPHSADFTKLYSAGQWATLPFYEKDIAADKNLKTLRLRQ
jgi:acyl-homoserine-lactone acylase